MDPNRGVLTPEMRETFALMDQISSAVMLNAFHLIEAPDIVNPETGERREPTDEQKAAYREAMLKMMRE